MFLYYYDDIKVKKMIKDLEERIEYLESILIDRFSHQRRDSDDEDSDPPF